jgi:uncharacterized protein (UPF0335 family)
MSLTAAEIAARHNASVKPAAGPGHNSRVAGVPDALGSYVDRLMNLVDEKERVAEDIKELKAEAKENGVDAKALVATVKLKRETAEQSQKREKFESVVASYMAAAGMLS